MSSRISPLPRQMRIFDYQMHDGCEHSPHKAGWRAIALSKNMIMIGQRGETMTPLARLHQQQMPLRDRDGTGKHYST